LVPLTETLAEVRSLAVHESQQGKGLGGYLVLELVQMARVRGFHQVCALTLRENFFVRLGFETVDRWSISPKVWQACIYCRKFHRCDEVAVLMSLVEKPETAAPGGTPAWSHLLKWNEWRPLKLAYQQKQPISLADGSEKQE
jgi:amino-acid N-acetyltransferase